MTSMSPESDASRYAAFFQRATGNTPFKFQLDVHRTGLPETIEAPTGAGKTKAVFVPWLFRRVVLREPGTPRQFVFALPTQSLTTQTAREIEALVESAGCADEVSVHVLFGGNLTREEQDQWRDRLDHTRVLVCTVDQLISRLLFRGYASRRHAYPIDAGVIGNDTHIVVDETQLAPQAAHTIRQLVALQNKLGTYGTVTLTCMSATLDPRVLTTIDAGSPDVNTRLRGLIENDPAMHQRITASRRIGELTAKDSAAVAAHALSLLEPGELVLVMVNTVETASDVYKALKRRSKNGEDVRLLHSRFRPLERQAVGEEVLGKNPLPDAGRIIVSTQVIEAGVDIDANHLISEVAPWPSLIQRAGRCNRIGRHSSATFSWTRPLTGIKAQPYDADDLERSVDILTSLDGQEVTSAQLSELSPDGPAPELVTIRRRDVLPLFDTSQDLAGRDIDISLYIRENEPLDVFLAWVDWAEWKAAGRDNRSPHSFLWCPVSIGKAKKFITDGRKAEVYQSSAQEWRAVAGQQIVPGMVIVLDAREGGYTAETGFSPSSKSPVPLPVSVPAGTAEEDSNSDDSRSMLSGWVSLEDHSHDARHQVTQLLAHTEDLLGTEEATAVAAAAFAHDCGKASAEWQRGILATGSTIPEEGIWAKSDNGSTRSRLTAMDTEGRLRVGYRHEFASAIVLNSPDGRAWLTGQGVASTHHDLAIYLAAAHHGKVRMRLRSPDNEPNKSPTHYFGVHHGDVIPCLLPQWSGAPTLAADFCGEGNLAMAWSRLTTDLLDRYGPYRLAFLETLVRLADWRASAQPLCHQELTHA